MRTVCYFVNFVPSPRLTHAESEDIKLLSALADSHTVSRRAMSLYSAVCTCNLPLCVCVCVSEREREREKYFVYQVSYCQVKLQSIPDVLSRR